MSRSDPIKDLTGWVLHRLTANYWSLALGAVFLAPIVFAALLHLDRNGLTDWILAQDLAPVATSETARDTAGVIAGIDAAFITLYFSISLLVLTIAAGNLAVRLIDRWLGKRLVRVSIAGLSFSLVFAVLTMAAIDPQADLAETPLAVFAASVLLLAVNVVMLSVALHDLGRTMFVDKAIDAIARDASERRVFVEARPAFEGSFEKTIDAPRNGYIEGVDMDRLVKLLGQDAGTIRVCVAPGQHVLKGQTLVAMERTSEQADKALRCIPIGGFRSNSQGAVFQIRLLVEIAARALSPAVNDFYTALAVSDALAETIGAHCRNWVAPDAMPVRKGDPHVELPGQDFAGLFADPLAAFRQAAAPYPSVSIRMIGNLGRVVRLHCANSAGLHDFLETYARQLHAQAREQCDLEFDRLALDEALDSMRNPAE